MFLGAGFPCFPPTFYHGFGMSGLIVKRELKRHLEDCVVEMRPAAIHQGTISDKVAPIGRQRHSEAGFILGVQKASCNANLHIRRTCAQVRKRKSTRTNRFQQAHECASFVRVHPFSVALTGSLHSTGCFLRTGLHQILWDRYITSLSSSDVPPLSLRPAK